MKKLISSIIIFFVVCSLFGQSKVNPGLKFTEQSTKYDFGSGTLIMYDDSLFFKNSDSWFNLTAFVEWPELDPVFKAEIEDSINAILERGIDTAYIVGFSSDLINVISGLFESLSANELQADTANIDTGYVVKLQTDSANITYAEIGNHLDSTETIDSIRAISSDSISIVMDSLAYYFLSANFIDSLNNHLQDTINVYIADSLAAIHDSITALYDTARVHLDTLQAHNERINTNLTNINNLINDTSNYVHNSDTSNFAQSIQNRTLASVADSDFVHFSDTTDRIVALKRLTDSVANLIDGSGTTNYVPLFSGARTIKNSVIQESGGNIGVGRVPAQKIDVDGNLLLANSAASTYFYLGSINTYFSDYGSGIDFRTTKTGYSFAFSTNESVTFTGDRDGSGVGEIQFKLNGTATSNIYLKVSTGKITAYSPSSVITPASATGFLLENGNATANRVNCIGFGASGVFQSGMLNTWVEANTNNLSLYNWTGGAISRKLYLKDDTTFLGKDEAVTILPNGDVELSNNIQINDSSKFNITTVNQIYFTNRDSIVDNSGDIMLDLSGTNIIKVEIDENSEMDWQNAKTGSYRIEITNSDASEHTVSFADAKWYIEENEEGSITIPVSGVVMLGLYYNGYQMIVEGYNTYILYEL
jgi:hypothetical protein